VTGIDDGRCLPNSTTIDLPIARPVVEPSITAMPHSV
jgi:hypothetical protein